jgi:SAM-dependent methyltransferase
MQGAIEAFEQYPSEYDAWFERNPAAYGAELRAIRAALPASGSGLEIGVGTGRFAAPLGIRGGIDPSPAMAAIARARGVEVTIAKAEQLPFAAEKFDYALMVTTICFVDDLGAAFREAARVLKPGGGLVVGLLTETVRWEGSTQRERIATRSTAMRGSTRLRKLVASSSSLALANPLPRKPSSIPLTQCRMNSQLSPAMARDRSWC